MSAEMSNRVGSRVPRDRDGAAGDGVRLDVSGATGGGGHAGGGHAGRVTLPAGDGARLDVSGATGGGGHAGGGHAGRVTLPVRKVLDHRGPLSLDVSGAWYFITICAEGHRPWVGSRVPRDRDGVALDFAAIADAILAAARWYHQHGKWRLALFLVMPDHAHFIVHLPAESDGSPGVSGTDDGHAGRVTLPGMIQQFKSYLARTYGLKFQRGFWDTRLRDAAHYAEKFRYVCNNPVRKGLCEKAIDWPFVIAFDRESGEERVHKTRGGHAGGGHADGGHAGRVTLPGVVGNGAAGGGGHAGRVTLPVRKVLDHRGPLSLDVSGAWYFITICAEGHRPWVGSRVPRDRDGAALDFAVIADAILAAARWYLQYGKWRLALFLVMPDHAHFIVHLPAESDGRDARPARPGVVGTGGGHAGRVTLPGMIQQFKSYLSRMYGLKFQRGFWDTRLRDAAHYAEKFRYVCNNPVRKGLCEKAIDWPFVIAFDRESGEERVHKTRGGHAGDGHADGGHAGRVTLPGDVGHAGRVTLPGVAKIVSDGRDARPARPGMSGTAKR